MASNRFRPSARLVLLLAAALLVVGPAKAAETLYPQFFWRAPAGSNSERPLIITSGAAYPNGGLAVAGYREGEQEGEIERERYLYRIDAAGKTMWELRIETGDGVIGTLVRDARGGLVFCGGEDIVHRIDAAGRLDWIATGWWPPSEGSIRLPRNPTRDCDALLAMADGSVIVAATVYQKRHAQVARVTRIDSTGRVIWSRDTEVPADDGQVAVLLPLPDGDIEIVFDPRLPITNAHTLAVSGPAFDEWRISPDGHWRLPNRMQRSVPRFVEWRQFEALYRQGDRLVRVAEPTGEKCRAPFEEWSLDGSRLLAKGYFPSLGECSDAGGDANRKYPRGEFHIPIDLDPDFLANLPPTSRPVWYRLAPPTRPVHLYRFIEVWREARLPRGSRLYLFGGLDEIYVVQLPWPDR